MERVHERLHMQQARHLCLGRGAQGCAGTVVDFSKAGPMYLRSAAAPFWRREAVDALRAYKQRAYT